MKKWQIISSKIALDEPWFRVRRDKVRLPNGKIADDYFIWEYPDVCIAIPLTPDGKFILVKEYKHAAGEVVLSFPAGRVGKKEDPKSAALREMEEETGYVSDEMLLLGKLKQDPSKKTGSLHAFLAKNVKPKGRKKFDALEEIEALVMSPGEIKKLVNKGELCDSTSLAAMFLLKEKFPKIY